MLKWLKRISSAPPRNSGDISDQMQVAKLNRKEEVVEVNSGRIELTNKDGLQVIDIGSLTAIEIITTDQGPFSDDLFYIFHNGQKITTIASETPGAEQLLPEIQKLPGVDNQKIIDANTSTENARFLIWEAPDAPA